MHEGCPMPDTALALWHESSQATNIRMVQKPQGQWLEVHAVHSLISMGTERLVCMGRVPAALEHAMAVPYQEGSLNLPVKYGYSLVGRLHQPGDPNHQRLVHLLHPHQTKAWVDPDDIFLIPDGVSARRATLASNMETAVNAIWDAGVSVGDTILVVGYGLIGALLAELINKIPGTTVYVAEKQPTRCKKAMDMGLQLWETDTDRQAQNICDIAFHTSAQQEGLETAMNSVGQEGMVIELSWYGDRPIQVRLGGMFHAQRKAIRASQVSSIAHQKQLRWDFQRRKALVFELLKDERFDQLLTDSINFDALPEFFSKLRTGPPPGMGWTITYPSA